MNGAQISFAELVNSVANLRQRGYLVNQTEDLQADIDDFYQF